MKKYWLTATTLGALAALSLTACSSSSEDPSSSPTVESTASATADAVAAEIGLSQYGADADVAALEAITWTDGETQPTLEFESPFTVTASATLVNAEGDGTEVAPGDNVALDIVAFTGVDGSTLASTYDSGSSETYTMSEGMIDPALYSVIVGNNVGQTLIYATPDTSATVAEGEESPAVLYAVTVQSTTTVPDRASGTAVEPAAGLPTVTLDENGAPSVDFTGTEMPTELVAQTLIQGDGEELTADQSITANYTGWVWDGEEFDSSWSKGMPLTIPLSQLVQGWQQGLVGQQVGSQVLLVIPPELGYGDEDSGAIPGGSTLVFVVDILAAS